MGSTIFARHDEHFAKKEPIVDDGMRRWYHACPCCMSQAYPEVKKALDDETAAEQQSASAQRRS